jgi:hypothetical protein
MAKIEKFQIRSFEDKEHRKEYVIKVPIGASFLNKVKVLHDGIYAFYSVPNIIGVNSNIETFKILQPEETIPENVELVDILDIIFEVPDTATQDNKAEPTQGIMLFPIYKVIL